jgi:hypothetical protein
LIVWGGSSMAAVMERQDITGAVEIHHCTPQYLLGMRDRADEADLDGAGIEAWLEYEAECFRAGVDPDVSREELADLIEASTVALSHDEHRALHETDFVRWGRRGGLATLQRYGRAWFGLLGRRRHRRITPSQLTAAAAELAGHA